MDRAAAVEFSESMGQIGAGWWRQVAWARQQGIPAAMDMTLREWSEQYIGRHMMPSIERYQAAIDLQEQGLKQYEIADVLGVSDRTVREDKAKSGRTSGSD